MKQLVLGLASLRAWLNGPPELVDHREDPETLAPGDIPVETVGGCLELYTALPPWTLPREIDLQHYEEVETLVNAIVDFSRQHELEMEVELDGDAIGTIENGVMSSSLAEGLFAEWLRHLAATDPLRPT